MTERWVLWTHVGLIVLLQALDLATTVWFLRIGGLEGNPLVASWAHQIAGLVLFKAVGVLLICGLVFWLSVKSRSIFLAMMFLHHGLMFGVIEANLFGIGELRSQRYRWLYRVDGPDAPALVGRLYLRKGRTDRGALRGRLDEKPPVPGEMERKEGGSR